MTYQLRGENLQPDMTVQTDGGLFQVTHVLGGSVFGRSADDSAGREWNLGPDTQLFNVVEED